jgi:hypothetical protein
MAHCQRLHACGFCVSLGQDARTLFLCLGVSYQLARFLLSVSVCLLHEVLSFFAGLYRQLLRLTHSCVVDGLCLFLDFEYLLDELFVQLTPPVLPRIPQPIMIGQPLP